MKWNELLEWINMNVNSEEAIKEIGRGNGISLEELPASYSPIEHCTRSGVHYYAAKSRNQKTIALIQKRLGIIEGNQHVNQTKIQAN